MICFVTFLANMVRKSKYDLLQCSWLFLFNKGDITGFSWLGKHKYYIAIYVAIVAIIYVCLGLLSQMEIGMSHIRAEDTLMGSIIAWVSLSAFVAYVYPKVQEAELNEKL